MKRKPYVVWIVVIIIISLIGISFINPWLSIEDIIIWGIIGGVILPTFFLSCGRGSYSPQRSRWGRGRYSRKYCDGCHGPLPPDSHIGSTCPHCGSYISGERTVHRIFGIDVAETLRFKSEDDVGRVYRPRNNYSRRKMRKSNWWNKSKKEDGPFSSASSETVDPSFNDSENNPENSPFSAPFDELFKDQDQIKENFKSFINWVAVHNAIKIWVNETLTNDKIISNDERRDAWAKWEAWKAFERQGFDDPTILPALYIKELQNALKLEKKVKERELMKPVCPECGASGANIVPTAMLMLAEGKQEWMCKECGMIFY